MFLSTPLPFCLPQQDDKMALMRCSLPNSDFPAPCLPSLLFFLSRCLQANRGSTETADMKAADNLLFHTDSGSLTCSPLLPFFLLALEQKQLSLPYFFFKTQSQQYPSKYLMSSFQSKVTVLDMGISSQGSRTPRQVNTDRKLCFTLYFQYTLSDVI